MIEDWETAAQWHREGKIAEARVVYLRLLEQSPDHPQVLHLLGVAHLQTGQPAEAEKLVRRAIAALPSDGRFHNTLANILAATGRTAQAVDALGQAIRVAPEMIEAAVNRATLLVALGRPDEAETACRQILARHADHPGAMNTLGTALIRQGRYREAAEVFRQGVAAGHDPSLFNVNLASALEFANDLDGAQNAITAAMAARPDQPASLLMRGKIRLRQGAAQDALDDLAKAEPGLPQAVDRITLLGLRGLACDKLKQWDDAFQAFNAANQLRAAQPETRRHDGKRYQSLCALRRQQAEALPVPDADAPDDSPIFFVGFPRSGTTLLETILAAHPHAVTTGEHSPLAPLVEQLGNRSAADLDATERAAMRHIFQTRTEQVVGPLAGRRLVDKLPLNIINLGLIQALYPQAKVLVALRDPRDCVLSCYMQDFQLNDAMVNFLDLESTARTYHQVMATWLALRSNLSLAWMEYRYEDLVDGFDATLRAILDFTGLGWHEDILSYAQKASGRDISTPSYREVLRPVDRRAVARWRNYQTQIAPVMPLLAPYLRSFGYAEG